MPLHGTFCSGLFYLDHQLPDEQAKAHWLVKFSRGDSLALNTILKLESVWGGASTLT